MGRCMPQRRSGPRSSFFWSVVGSSGFLWDVVSRNPGRITVLILIGVQAVCGEDKPNVKRRAEQHSARLVR